MASEEYTFTLTYGEHARSQARSAGPSGADAASRADLAQWEDIREALSSHEARR